MTVYEFVIFFAKQCWAVLESKCGNIRRARELFDASTVADAKHVAGWHGWAILEIKQGNIKKARNLLGKALKYCGGNEYIYQTLALLEAKAERFEQARTLFEQATQSNPKSCASWLVSICFIIIHFICTKGNCIVPFLLNCAFMFVNFLVGLGSGRNACRKQYHGQKAL